MSCWLAAFTIKPSERSKGLLTECRHCYNLHSLADASSLAKYWHGKLAVFKARSHQKLFKGTVLEDKESVYVLVECLGGESNESLCLGSN